MIPEPQSEPDRAGEVRRALKRLAMRLARKLEGLQGDLDESRRASEFRRFGETLLAYAHLVPKRVKRVSLPDPADPANTIAIELDPAVSAPANAARYFKRAAKGERGMREVPPRIQNVKHELAALTRQMDAADKAADDDARAAAQLELERTLFGLGSSTRRQIKAPEPLPRRALGMGAAAAPDADVPKAPTTAAPAVAKPRRRDELPGKFQPWRFKSKEGWDVLIGRSSEANDHLTVHMARPEDYWFHAHGCSGSHVVLRRGKGVTEPSKATLEEVAAWAAFHSKARTAGKVPVIYTQKKYVRKPRGAKAGLVHVEREKMIMVRPVEPPREQMADGGGE